MQYIMYISYIIVNIGYSTCHNRGHDGDGEQKKISFSKQRSRHH